MTPLTQEKLLLLGLVELIDDGRKRSNERAGRVQVFAEAPRNARIKTVNPADVCDECFAYGPGMGCDDNCYVRKVAK